MCSININILHYECNSISLTLLLFLSRRLYRYACAILCRHMCCVIVGIVYLYVFFPYVPSYLHLSTLNLVSAPEFIGSFFSWIPSFVECRSAFAANYSQVLSLDATWHIFGATCHDETSCDDFGVTSGLDKFQECALDDQLEVLLTNLFFWPCIAPHVFVGSSDRKKKDTRIH